MVYILARCIAGQTERAINGHNNVAGRSNAGAWEGKGARQPAKAFHGRGAGSSVDASGLVLSIRKWRGAPLEPLINIDGFTIAAFIGARRVSTRQVSILDLLLVWITSILADRTELTCDERYVPARIIAAAAPANCGAAAAAAPGAEEDPERRRMSASTLQRATYGRLGRRPALLLRGAARRHEGAARGGDVPV